MADPSSWPSPFSGEFNSKCWPCTADMDKRESLGMCSVPLKSPCIGEAGGLVVGVCVPKDDTGEEGLAPEGDSDDGASPYRFSRWASVPPTRILASIGRRIATPCFRCATAIRSWLRSASTAAVSGLGFRFFFRRRRVFLPDDCASSSAGSSSSRAVSPSSLTSESFAAGKALCSTEFRRASPAAPPAPPGDGRGDGSSEDAFCCSFLSSRGPPL
mmetsp:Transcript_48/g.234  ORF Transcript_48/g.234 Transcript_48/m.234 type:complete len:215 (-) Transcript_48:1260-1904(-)